MMRIVVGIMAVLAGGVLAAKTVALPEAAKTGGQPLMEALAARHSDRRTEGPVPTLQQLSDLLWAANGVSRPNGKRTAPSAMNRQEIELAVLTAEGLAVYDPKAHQLVEQASEVDLADQLNKASALLILFYDTAKQPRDYALVDAGFVGQNIYLFCTSKGWASVFLGTVDRAKVAQALGRTEQEILFAHRIGVK